MRHRRAADTAALAAGTLVNGALAYAFFAIVTRSLGAEAGAPVSVLWTYWAAAAAALTFPLQHWTIRTLAADGHESTVARALPVIWLGTAVLAALSGLGAFLARETLFAGPEPAFALLVAGVTAGSCLSGLVRGGLAGRGRYVATAWALGSENAVRVALALVVALAGGGAVAFGVALLVGPLAGLRWPESLRFRDDGRTSSAGSPLALASGLAGGSLIAQIVLTGGPVALAVVGGQPRQITSLFVALALWRAPYLVALGLSTQLTDIVTGYVTGGQVDRLRALRRLVVAGTAAGSIAAGLAAVTVANPVLRLVFGPDVSLDAFAMVLVGVGTVLALANLVLLLMLLARGRSGTAAGAWVAALGVATAWLAGADVAPLERVVVAFAGAQATAFVVMLVGETTASRAGTRSAPLPLSGPAPPAT